jgi:50S ribosomal protein L16 3-hydroxylase
MHFQNFDADAFLRDYWQQRPLLIRNPWAAWVNPLEPDELAGLACEESVESRLIERAGDDWPDNLKAENGPFGGERLSGLAPSHWTLLVQAVDHYIPDVAALIAPFRFIPNWRIDDVMVSIAADGGGVGPHFDQYDVFLIQGLGKRRWQIGPKCDANSPLLPHEDLRLLADFKVIDEWVLEPGDILYVPPGIAHNGVAVGDDCMTYSVGFRAPSRGELIENYADDLLDMMSDDDRYVDAGLSRQSNPGEIGEAALAALHAMITDRINDRDAFARWFGKYNSAPKYPDMDWSPDEPVEAEELRTRLASGDAILRNPASRFSFVRRQAGGVMLFADGECFICDGENAAMAEMICAQDHFSIGLSYAENDAALAILAQLFAQGSIAFADEE